MDIVYPCRSGPNEELRYSLRSIAQHVHHDNVHIIGDAPTWVAVDEGLVQVKKCSRMRTKYRTTTAHVRTACQDDDISDPFLLFNDDFYAVRPVGAVQPVHRGTLEDALTRYRGLRSTWGAGLRATAQLLQTTLSERRLLSYEVHAPLIVHKDTMLQALDMTESMSVEAPHKRTIYGNLADLGGEQITDPKWTNVKDSAPNGPWMSSEDSTFQRVVLPVLKWSFPHSGPYERKEP